MPVVLNPPDQRVVLPAVTWATYEKLLSDHADVSVPRFTFDRGVLEIMSPSSEHEECNRTLALVVEVIAEEWGLDIRNLGSTTFKREDFQRGFEADSCFYIQSAPQMSQRSRVDPAVDPPPDLVIEVDITNTALGKFPVYAEFRVPELWRYDGTRAAIFKLTGSEFVENEVSVAFPQLSAADLSRFLQQARTMRRPAWLKMLRNWARKSLPSRL